MHGSILAIKKKDVKWARKASLAQMRKFDRTQVDEPLVKKLVAIFVMLLIHKVAKMTNQFKNKRNRLNLVAS